jgi:ankyrin repeat protein
MKADRWGEGSLSGTAFSERTSLCFTPRMVLLYCRGMNFSRSLLAFILLGLCGLKAWGEDKQEWLQNELYRACHKGSLEETKKLLAAGASAKLVSEGYNELPLNLAISMGSEELVKLLVEHGASLKDPEGSALAVAARGVSFPYSESSTIKMIDLLLSLGADAHANDEEAMAAAAGTGLSIVQTLEKAGGKPTRRALVVAVRSCHLDVIEHLVKAGMDPTTTDKDGRTLLHEAADWTAADPNAEPGRRQALWNRLLALGISINARDRKGRSPLFEASTLEIIGWLLEKRADVNLKDHEGMTVLMQAAGDAFDWVKKMQLLLKAGADLKVKDREGRSVLDVAAAAEAWAETSLLIAEGAVIKDPAGMLTAMAQATLDHNTPSRHVAGVTAHLLPLLREPNKLRVDGLPLLFWPVMINNQAVAQQLLKAGGDMNATDADGNTPLMMAVLTGNEAIKERLVAAGADTSRKNNQGLTAGELTPYASNREGSIDAGSSDGSPVPDVAVLKDDIFDAVAGDRMEDVRRLIAQNPAVLKQMRGGVQPLHLAVASGYLPMVEWLLRNGGTLTAKTADHQSCLEVAVFADQPEMARWLMKQTDVFERKELMRECRQLWTEDVLAGRNRAFILALHLALEAGWKPDDQADAGEALALAVCCDDLPTTQRLLSLGARLAPAGEVSRDPFMDKGKVAQNLVLCAVKNRNMAMLKFLVEKITMQRAGWQADINAALHFAVSSGNLPMVKVLAEQAGADVNAGTHEYCGSVADMIRWHEDKSLLFTPICLALEQSSREVAKYLLQKGATLTGRDGAGRQVLASAVATGSLEMVRLMLDHGAALEAKDGEGCTALHESVRRGLLDITELLLGKGASREARDSMDRTPAQVAEDEGQPPP